MRKLTNNKNERNIIEIYKIGYHRQSCDVSTVKVTFDHLRISVSMFEQDKENL